MTTEPDQDPPKGAGKHFATIFAILCAVLLGLLIVANASC